MPPMTRLSALSLWMLSSVHAQDTEVPAREIGESWTGKTLSGSTAQGATASMQFQADGTAVLQAGRMRDTGSWRVSESGYCTTWKTVRAGEERCFTVRRAGNRLTVLNPDGSVSGYFNDPR